MSYDGQIERAGRLLREARYAIALTGAGISTPSGIPDFRSPGSGLWETANPFVVASIYGFRLRPRAFYDWVRPLAAKAMTAEPNPGHTALAALESHGVLKAIITQNIDGLHHKAGSHEVLELHGHMREMSCLRCHRVASTDERLEAFLSAADASAQVPRCETCGGVMKPNVVLFGEPLLRSCLDV